MRAPGVRLGRCKLENIFANWLSFVAMIVLGKELGEVERMADWILAPMMC